MARKTGDVVNGQDDTRQRLLRAAGELFAERGFGEVSVREIARAAGANVAAMNYHFSSKEKLFIETVSFVLAQMGAIRRDLLGEAPDHLSPSEAMEVLQRLIDHETRAYLSSAVPRWYPQLLLRCVISKSPVLNPIFEQAFRPNNEALRSLLRAVCPELTESTAELWAYSITGQIVFYCLAREPVLLLRREKAYSEAFLKRVVAHITQVILGGLGLRAAQPLPAKAKSKTKTGK